MIHHNHVIWTTEDNTDMKQFIDSNGNRVPLNKSLTTTTRAEARPEGGK